MRPRLVQQVQIWAIQYRPPKPKPWGVRWAVDGEPHSKWYPTDAEADSYRSRLIVARQDGEWFDQRSGEPESWHPAADDQQLHAWARDWLQGEWPTWAPRSRDSAVEALCRFLPLVADPKAPEVLPGLRAYLRRTLPPDAPIDDADEHERWLNRWVLALRELDPDQLAEVDRRLGIGDVGQQLAASTAGRFRKVSRACVRRAAELKGFPDPWPQAPKGRSRRKASRQHNPVDVERLPDPTTMVAIIAAIPSHQPGSRKYQLMTAIAYYAGLRPSEVRYLRPRAMHLPETGWGWIRVLEADDGYDRSAEPKTGRRLAPIPPVLVGMLRAWIAEHDLSPDQLLFRTRTGKAPAESNWNRALKRACRTVGYRELCPYDARHACATTWLHAGVGLGEAARRLGHSVETLVGTYVGALEGDDRIANDRIDAALQLGGPIVAATAFWLLPAAGR